MNWNKPFGRSWTFWLGSLSAAYTAAAGLWATLPGAGYGQRENAADALRSYYMAAGGTLA